MAVKPLRAYEGKEPYIFISYAHKDSDTVLPIIRKFQDEGYRIWYDAGIEAGTEWPEYIAEHIKECACFVCFISQSALDSHNCRREINYAIKLKKNILTAYLEDTELTDGMEMQLDILQAIFKSRHDSDESFVDELLRSALLKACKAPQTTPETDLGTGIKTKQESEVEATPKQTTKPELEVVVDTTEEAVVLESIDVISEKAEAGDALAQLTLAGCYDNGDLVPQDPEAAEYWYKKAAENGNDEAILTLVKKHRRINKFIEGETELLLKAAENGNSEAQYEMGIYFSLDKKNSEAVRWFYKAAGQEHGKAQFECGNCCLYGMGVPRNKEKAVEWYTKAYANGGLEEKYVPIMDNYIHAIRYNDPDAQCKLGLYYLAGDILYTDPYNGLSWIEKSADQGWPEAQNLLAVYHENNNYIFYHELPFKTEEKALQLYEAAARQGYAFAQYNLGRCCEFGIGIEKNFQEAYEWYTKAAENGIEEAQERLDSLAMNGFIRLLRGIKKVPPLTDGSIFRIYP